MSETATTEGVEEPGTLEPAVEPVEGEPQAPENGEEQAPTADEIQEWIAAEAEAVADARLAQVLQQAQQYQQPPPQPGMQLPNLDPYDENFGVNLAQFIAFTNAQTVNALRQDIQQIQAPIAAAREAEVIETGEDRLKDMIADDIARNGDFAAKPEADAKARALVRTLANNHFDDAAARYGSTPRAAEWAIQMAAREVRGILGETSESAVSREANRLSTLAGARSEPGASGAGVQTLPGTPLSNQELAVKYGQQAKALRG